MEELLDEMQQNLTHLRRNCRDLIRNPDLNPDQLKLAKIHYKRIKTIQADLLTFEEIGEPNEDYTSA